LKQRRVRSPGDLKENTATRGATCRIAVVVVEVQRAFDRDAQDEAGTGKQPVSTSVENALWCRSAYAAKSSILD
jgi:hypothetical protein